MKKILSYAMPAVLVAAMMSAGCEWESTSDVYSNLALADTWANFSGLYRAPSGGEIVVPQGSIGSSAATDTDSDSTNTTTDVTGDGMVTLIVSENLGTIAANTTSLAGMFDPDNRPEGVGIDPGSVTLVFTGTGLAGGTATDAGGGGVLAGTYNVVGIDPAADQPIVGTMEYGSGVWTADLQAGGFLEPHTVVGTYTYTVPEGTATPVVATPATPGSPGSGSGTGGATSPVYSFTIQQLGRTLELRDNYNHVYSGMIVDITTDSANVVDDTLTSSSRVVATFRVEGEDINGTNVEIFGTLEGTFSGSTENAESRVIDGIVMQATWIEASGVYADIFAQTAN